MNMAEFGESAEREAREEREEPASIEPLSSTVSYGRQRAASCGAAFGGA